MTPPGTTIPQVIGQTENALRALLHRALDGTGSSFHQWVTLRLLSNGAAPAELDRLATRITGALKIDLPAALEMIDELVAAHLAHRTTDPILGVELTQEGQAQLHRTRAAVDQIISRLFDGLAADDLATTVHVLTLITARADAELDAPNAPPSPH